MQKKEVITYAAEDSGKGKSGSLLVGVQTSSAIMEIYMMFLKKNQNSASLKTKMMVNAFTLSTWEAEAEGSL